MHFSQRGPLRFRLPSGSSDRGSAKLFHFSTADVEEPAKLTVEAHFDKSAMLPVVLKKNWTVARSLEALAQIIRSDKTKSLSREPSKMEVVRQLGNFGSRRKKNKL